MSLRVLCLVPYELRSCPSQRFRWEQWAPFLAAEGVDVEFISFCTGPVTRAHERGSLARTFLAAGRRYPAWLSQLRTLPRADVVVIHRNAALAGPPIVEAALCASPIPVVYDFDDAIHLPPPMAPARLRSLRRAVRCDWRVAYLCPRADLVTVGNGYLCERATAFGANAETWPTTVSMGNTPPKNYDQRNAVPVIGWTGSPTTAHHLRGIMPMLRALRQHREFRLRVIGAEVDLLGVPGECLPWRAATETADLHTIDIGIMPLEDNDFSRGKCALKAIQYLAAQIPAVVDDVGAAGEVVRHDESGFVVRGAHEWATALETLLADSKLRQNMGQRGRIHMEREYSAEAWTPQFAQRLVDLKSSRRGRAALPDQPLPSQ